MLPKILITISLACLCCMSNVSAGPGDGPNPPTPELHDGRRYVRDLDLSSVIGGLANQFFKNGGQTGVNELSNSAPAQKPNVLQKYLGGAAGAALMSAVMGGMSGGNNNQNSGSQNTLAKLASHPLVLQLIQVILQKFGGGGGNTRSARPEPNAMQLPSSGDGSNNFGNNGNQGSYQDGNAGSGTQKQKSGSGTGSAIMMAIAKQLLKSWKTDITVYTYRVLVIYPIVSGTRGYANYACAYYLFMNEHACSVKASANKIRDVQCVMYNFYYISD